MPKVWEDNPVIKWFTFLIAALYFFIGWLYLIRAFKHAQVLSSVLLFKILLVVITIFVLYLYIPVPQRITTMTHKSIFYLFIIGMPLLVILYYLVLDPTGLVKYVYVLSMAGIFVYILIEILIFKTIVITNQGIRFSLVNNFTIDPIYNLFKRRKFVSFGNISSLKITRNKHFTFAKYVLVTTTVSGIKYACVLNNKHGFELTLKKLGKSSLLTTDLSISTSLFVRK